MGLWLLAILALGAITYGLYGLYLGYLQRTARFSPTHVDAQAKGNSRFKPWRVSGDFLGYVRSVAHPRRIVLLFHGGAGEALDRAWADELVSDQDLFVLVEYPGYGARPGDIQEAAFME